MGRKALLSIVPLALATALAFGVYVTSKLFPGFFPDCDPY